MSGFEILCAIASSIALAQAVKGTVKAIDFLRQASEMKKECNRLMNEASVLDEPSYDLAKNDRYS